MPTPLHDKPDLPTRRAFLKTVAVTGGAATVGLGTSVAVAEVRRDQEPELANRESGYRETPHIRDYYAKANF